jgi:hypothetical protein
MKKFLIILTIVVIGLGAWWFLASGRSYIFLGRAPISSAGVVAGTSTASFVSSGAVANVVNDAVARTGRLLSSATSSVATTLTNAGAIVLNTTNGAIDGAFESMVGAGRNFLGIATSTTLNSGSPKSVTSTTTALCQNSNGVICIFVDSVAIVGQPISFTVDGLLFSENNAKEIDAHINWGDGVDEYQKLYVTDGSYALTHTFTATGTYQSLFAFDIGTSTVQYEMKIMVQP